MNNSLSLSERLKQNPPRRVLVLMRDYLGDIVCTTTALRALRRLFPQAHLVIEAGEQGMCALENNPNFDDLIIRREHQGLIGKARFVRQIRNGNFDLGVVLDDCADASLYLWLARIPIRTGLSRKRKFAKLYTDGLAVDHSLHEIVDNPLRVVENLGGDVSNRRPELFPQESDETAADALLAENGIQSGETIVALNPGASLVANRWLPERFAEVGDMLVRNGMRVVILGGSTDVEIAKLITRAMTEQAIVLTGRMNFLELAAVLKRCSVMVTADTGPMHVACAVSTPVVAVFGPALPHESGPHYVPGNVSIRMVDECRRCTKKKCRNDRSCMRAISAEQVVEAATRLIDATGSLTSSVLATCSERSAVGIAK